MYLFKKEKRKKEGEVKDVSCEVHVVTPILQMKTLRPGEVK